MNEHEDPDDIESSDPTPEQVYKKGRSVYSLHWDSGGPGAGAGAEVIIKLDDDYWVFPSGGGMDGPHSSLKSAIGRELCVVTSATEAIYSSELRVAEILALIELCDVEEGQKLTINRGVWQVNAKGVLVRCRRRP